MKKNVYYLIFVGIILIGLGLRTWHLSAIPFGFFSDEASIGYNAYTILTHGTSDNGIPFPVFFKAFGEYKSPIQIYSTVPFVAIFGLNEFSTRLPSVLYGVLSMAALYLLVTELFKEDKKRHLLALLSMFFLAISPWAIHFSRVSLEGLMAFVFFTTLGLYLLLKAQRSPTLLPVSIIVFAFALYSYFPARIFIPLFCIGLLVIYARFFLSHKKEFIISLFVLIILLVPFIQNLFSPGGFARWQQVNIFSNPPKGNTVLQHIATNYFRNFSADFLFLKGDIDMPGQFITRHSVRGMGELYLFQLPFVIFGLFSLLKRKDKAFLILLLWLIVYPVGSMFTTDASPQATRSIIGVIPFQILSAVGAVYLLGAASKLKKPFYLTSIGIAVGIIIFSFANYLSLYFVSYVTYSSDYWGWQYGARPVMGYFLAHRFEYDEMYMTDEAFNAANIFIPFYDPTNLCEGKCRVGRLDRYNAQKKQLFAIDASHMNLGDPRIHVVQIIYYPTAQPAFFLSEISH